DDWLISCDDIRQPLLDANATVEWTPSFYSKRMDDWLRNMDDWNISRKRYFGLPLPLYPFVCGHLNVIGSKRELEERSVFAIDDLPELHRPWIDKIVIECEECGEATARIPEVGDAWLDAGIVPFSTLGWQNPEWIEHGYATGASVDLSGADLPDHAYWEKWFPADWVSESREQIRLWFYSQCFMAVTLDGRSPYQRVLTYERVRDETGREMHKSWGNAIEANEAVQRMGADVVRWLFTEQIPSQNVNFGYGPAAEIKRRLLTYWNSVRFFVDYANIVEFVPGAEPAAELQPLDHWLNARTEQLVSEMTDAYERFWTPDVIRAFESFVDDLSNWYIRRSRRRFWDGDTAALWTLWGALTQSLRVIGPIMPFLAAYLWRVLRAEDLPASVIRAGWPVAVRQALAAGGWEGMPGGGVRVSGRELGADEVLVERTAREGWALAEEGGITVALSTELDDELLLEGRVFDLIHLVNTKRKDAGLELTDRITLTLPESDADLLAHEQWIKDEVLAVEIRTDGVAEPQIAKV